MLIGKRAFSLAVLMIVTTLFAFAQKQVQSVPHYTNLGLAAESNSRISTLYALDPLANSLCFADGKEGGVIQRGGVYNRCSHIEFDRYQAGSLTVAVEGGETGAIVDLGSQEELRKAYGYAETGSMGQGFASISFREGKIMIRKGRKNDELQELNEGQRLLQQETTSSASATAKAGHIYLARIVDRHNKDFQILVKLLVLRATPGDAVTFRWELL